jgi:hypothetical protein
MSGFTCTECGWHGEQPCTTWFQMGGRPKEAIQCCPECMGVNATIRLCCQEPGCTEEAGCGTPTADGGYKQHCHKHPPRNAK